MLGVADKCERNRNRLFRTDPYQHPNNNTKTRGRVVHCEYKDTIPQQAGFTTEDILWTIGIWSVMLTATPVVVFYMLMVA